MTTFSGSFPSTRLRRPRRHPWSRQLVAENTLTPADLIWPVFVIEGKDKQEAIASMPGVTRLSIDLLVKAAGEAKKLGIPAIAVFPKIE
ncbi:MAG: porphobilinogen synthase, partial [Rhodospirillales bacterium]